MENRLRLGHVRNSTRTGPGLNFRKPANRSDRRRDSNGSNRCRHSLEKRRGSRHLRSSGMLHLRLDQQKVDQHTSANQSTDAQSKMLQQNGLLEHFRFALPGRWHTLVVSNRAIPSGPYAQGTDLGLGTRQSSCSCGAYSPPFRSFQKANAGGPTTTPANRQEKLPRIVGKPPARHIVPTGGFYSVTLGIGASLVDRIIRNPAGVPSHAGWVSQERLLRRTTGA